MPPTALPAGVAAALTALAPKRVVVVGGPVSVSDEVVGEVRSLLGGGVGVSRISGTDRYEVSRTLATMTFPAGSWTAYTATGTTFPDALSAGPAAAAFDSPLVLVNGAAPAADAATIASLAALRPSGVSIAGGEASVSAGVETSIARITPVTRYGGADRYAVAIALNARLLRDFSTVYLATGATFPDALVGGVLAATRQNPLYVVPGNCVPAEILSTMVRLGTRNVVLLGGPVSLGPGVEHLVPC